MPRQAPELPAALAEAVFARVEGLSDALVDLTRALVRIPTVNPPGDAYRVCAEALGEHLRRLGFEVRYLRAEGAPGDHPRHPRVNVLARREGARPGPCVHFNGHIDVVEPGAGWTVDPFAGMVRDGRVYGRGTCDMKGGIAAAVIAAEALIACGIDLPGAIEVSGTVDEETGGFAGVAWMAEQGLFSAPRVDHVIIPEPLNVDGICLGHRGVWWAEVGFRGRIAHGSMPFLGVSAIRAAGAFLAKLEGSLLPMLAARRTRMPVIPPGARASTLNVNAIHGGVAEGGGAFPPALVADHCRLVLDRRFLVEERLEDVKAEIVALLEDVAREWPGIAYEVREIMTFLPTLTDADAPVVRALGAAVQAVLGRPAALVASPGTYDQKHIARIGHLHDCVAYGPGILELAHQPDEYVRIDDMVNAAKVMALAALRLYRLVD